MFIVELVLWFAVSLLCIQCLNQEDESEHSWAILPKWKKFLVVCLAPVFFIFERASKAFKK